MITGGSVVAIKADLIEIDAGRLLSFIVNMPHSADNIESLQIWTLSNSITVDKPHQKGAPCLKVCTRTRM